MENLIFGEGRLSHNEVIRVIQKSSSFARLLRSWRSFARSLNVNDAKIAEWGLRIPQLLPLEEILPEVLISWKAMNGNNANLKVLCDALIDCGLKDIADSLESKFAQLLMENLTFRVHDQVQTLSKLFGESIPDRVSNHINAIMKKHSYSFPILLFKENYRPPANPNYYIARTFSLQVDLKQEIFTAASTKTHVFLVKGITIPELAKLSDFQPIEMSGTQLEKTTARFMIMECEEDFEIISGKTSNPVHAIEFKENRMRWLRSSKGFAVLHSFLKESAYTFTEERLANKIKSLPSPCAFSIADTPGIGKSLVLASLANKVTGTKDTVLFIELTQQFVRDIASVDIEYCPIESLSKLISADDIVRPIVGELLQVTTYKWYFFLDGYDEVLEASRKEIDKFVTRILLLPNVKIVVTTRPHLAIQLEELLCQVSSQILPFDESSQREFLTKYWIQCHKASAGQLLENFADQCLKALQTDMSDGEGKIAGIPLLCRILAEVYAEYAIRYSKIKLESNAIFKIRSVFDMYKHLMDLKFGRDCTKVIQKKYWDAHVYDAISLLFNPYWVDNFKPYLHNREEIEKSVLYSIGIIEKSIYTNTSKFVHRTFAEYVLAEFIVEHLGEYRSCQQLLFGNILQEQTWLDKSAYKYKYSPLIYFVESNLRSRLETNERIEISLSNFGFSESDSYNIYKAAETSCIAGLEYCFETSTKFFSQIDESIRRNILNSVWKENKCLVHCVVHSSESISMVEKVLNWTKTEFRMELGNHILTDDHEDIGIEDVGWIYDQTPLHIAIHQGKYNIVTYLINQYGKQVYQIRQLLHMCTRNSKEQSDVIIQWKAAILDLLINKNRNWLEERCAGRTPLLEKDVHPTIIKYLLKNGANINACSHDRDTILGKVIHDGRDIIQHILSSGFELVNYKNCQNKTPLMSWIAFVYSDYYKDEDLLHSFFAAGADFNAEDENGHSVLFYCLSYVRDQNFINMVIDYGACIYHRDKENRNAAHHTLDYYIAPSEMLSKLKLLESRGFTGFNQKDSKGLTPLDIASESCSRNEEGYMELRRFLRKKVANDNKIF